jgi:TPR repeat protein
VFSRKGSSGGTVFGLVTGKSQYALTATTHEQRAAEDADRKGGVFTLALLEALRIKEAVELSEVGKAVRKAVREKSADMLPLCQTVSDEVSDGELVFFPKVIPDEEIAAMRQAITARKISSLGEGKSVLAGVQQRREEAVKRRTPMKDVIDAYQAIGYEYSSDPEKRKKEWREKVGRFVDNADEGDANAAAALVYCYAKGLGVKADPDLALHYARLAESTGQAVGLHVLGKCYLEGLGVKENGKAGMGYVKQAADAKQPCPISLVSLGMDALMAGPERQKEAREFYEKAYDAGVLVAACWLADELLVKYRWDWTDDEVKRVEKMLKPAAAGGGSWAKQQLAELYARRPNPDLVAAEKWLRAAADDGHARAQYLLARELTDPKLHIRFDERRLLALKSDPTAASDYAMNAAKQQDPLGMALLACMHTKGYGNARQSDADAQKWCNEAVKANEPKAQLLRSKWYAFGEAGLSKDPDKAGADAWDAVHKGHTYYDRDAVVWLAALYADRAMPAKAPYLDPKWDKDGGKFVYEHYALHYYFLATQVRHSGADDGFKEFTDRIRKNPDETFWQFFQRDFPDAAKELAKQEKLPLKK